MAVVAASCQHARSGTLDYRMEAYICALVQVVHREFSLMPTLNLLLCGEVVIEGLGSVWVEMSLYGGRHDSDVVVESGIFSRGGPGDDDFYICERAKGCLLTSGAVRSVQYPADVMVVSNRGERSCTTPSSELPTRANW